VIYLRNRKTTEYKSVVPDSEEYYDLVGQRDPEDHRPIWEQVSAATASDFAKRVESGDLRDTDVGDDGQPTGDFTGQTEPDATHGPDFTEPTPGEVAQGAGRAAEEGEAPDVAGVASPGDPGVAQDPLAGLEEQPDTAAREAPAHGTESQSEYKAQDKADLQDEIDRREAEGREIPVEGTGSGGNVTKPDLVRALEADDAATAAGGGASESESSE
jgi:hypothetical protein